MRRLRPADTCNLDEYLEAVQSVGKWIEFAQNRKRAKQNRSFIKRLVRPLAGIPVDHQGYMRLMIDCHSEPIA